MIAFFAVALFALPLSSAQGRAVPINASGQICPHLARNFARKAELPTGVLAALGVQMAERGAAWNVGDAVGAGPQLPFDRFLSAHQAGCNLVVNWEHGGIAHYNQSATLTLRGNRWIVTSRH